MIPGEAAGPNAGKPASRAFILKGMALAADSPEDRPFHHYTLKHRATAWVSLHLFDGATYTVRHGLLKGMKRKGGLGWVPQVFSRGEMTAEHEFWQKLDLQGMTVYDIGAFQGLLALFFASRAQRVVCFEPNSRNHRRLMENLELNGIRNVTVRKVGVGSRHETLRMVSNPLMMGGSSVDGKTVEELLRSGAGTVAEEIPVVTLDREIGEAGLPAPDFIKIDIEGWEIEALRGARQTIAARKPALFLEMHGETLAEKKRKAAEIVAFLWEAGYRDIRHIESGAAIAPANAEAAREGHLYCRPASAS